jgi:hypothetical protein
LIRDRSGDLTRGKGEAGFNSIKGIGREKITKIHFKGGLSWLNIVPSLSSFFAWVSHWPDARKKLS